jgi:surfactin synthase thioesterase subunit
VELWAVQLPGRAARFGEPAAKILEGVVSEVAPRFAYDVVRGS